MSYFKGLKLTKKGEQLQAKINGNLSETLTFTKAKLGSGTIASENEIRFLTGLKEEWGNASISRCEIKNETQVEIELQFDNSSFSENKIFREIGLYARAKDNVEVLFAYANAGENCDYIPAVQDSPHTFIITIHFGITSGTKVDATIDLNSYVTLEKLNTELAKKENKIEKKTGFNLDKTSKYKSKEEDEKLFTQEGANNLYKEIANGVPSQEIGASDTRENQPPSFVSSGHVRFLMSNEEILGDTNYKDWIYMDTYNSEEKSIITAFGVSKGDTIAAFIMQGEKGSSTWERKAKLWHSGNFDPNTKLNKVSAELFTDEKNITDAINQIASSEYPFTKDLIINGDANTYYPVVFYTDESSKGNLKLSIRRKYNEQAPSTWNTVTHKGSLTLDLDISLHDWDGSIYYCQGFFQQSYAKIISKMERKGPGTNGIVVWLRGGGAIYHIRSNGKNLLDTFRLYYNKFTETNGGYTYNALPTTRVEDYRFDSNTCAFTGDLIYSSDRRFGAEVFARNNKKVWHEGDFDMTKYSSFYLTSTESGKYSGDTPIRFADGTIKNDLGFIYSASDKSLKCTKNGLYKISLLLYVQMWKDNNSNFNPIGRIKLIRNNLSDGLMYFEGCNQRNSFSSTIITRLNANDKLFVTSYNIGGSNTDYINFIGGKDLTNIYIERLGD